MKTKKKGFSLVELICTLTIAAIIAVAAAPNVSAYILNSKIQNYQTALNNLVDELQFQLPQKRYWNWQEVSNTANNILSNDFSRNISSSDSDDKTTYTLTNVSTDEHIRFELDVIYGELNGIKREITINGRCIDYPSVTSEDNKCTVILKNNYVDMDNHPTITVPGTEGRRDGWFNLLDDRVKPYKDTDSVVGNDWTSAFTLPEFKDNNFLKVPRKDDELGVPDESAVYINTTDYPADSVSDITFMMAHYLKTPKEDGKIQYAPLYPDVMVQFGAGTGEQYSACSKGENFEIQYKNVYILVGADENDEDNWVKYTDVFEPNYMPKSIGYTHPDTPAGRYIQYYGDNLKRFGNDDIIENVDINPIIKYRVHLSDPTNDDGSIRSRGWVSIIARCAGDTGNRIIGPYYTEELQSDGTIKKIYQGVSVKVKINNYESDEQLKKRIERHTSSESEICYFDSQGLTPITGLIDEYRDSIGNWVRYNKNDYGTVVGQENGANISVYYSENNYPIKKENDGSYYVDKNEKVYVPELQIGNCGYTIKKDHQGLYVEGWNNGYWRIDLGNRYDLKEGWKYFEQDDYGVFYSVYSKYYLSQEETNIVNEDLARIRHQKNGMFFLHLDDCGYSVGDVFKITFKNIDVDKFADTAEQTYGTTFVNMWKKEVYYSNEGSFLWPTVFYDSPNIDTANKGKAIRDYENQTVTIYLCMEWADYPYLSFNYGGALNGFDTNIDISITWGKKTTPTATDPIEIPIPMATINGNDKYTVLTFDWSKCDYIDSSNLGSVVINFSETLKYTIYDKNYNDIGYSGSCNSDKFFPTLITDANALSDRVVHLYFEGISSSEISYTLSYPESE